MFFFCNITIIEIQFFLALCPSFPSSTSLCRFSSRSLVVVEFIVFPKIIWHILIGTWPSCTFRSRLCWFQRSWQQEAFYFPLFQINYSGVPPQNWIKSRLFLFWLSFIIPSLIAHLQFNYIALLPRNAEKNVRRHIEQLRLPARCKQIIRKCENFCLSMKRMLKTSTY